MMISPCKDVLRGAYCVVVKTQSSSVAMLASYGGHARLESYSRSNIGAQTYFYNGMGDRVRVDKPTGTRHFVYDSQGRVGAGSAAERAQRGQYGA